ncbi:hypothetical protein RD792_001444 [Penstemon davidsonii]|uniref:UDP-glycosyltransferase n=1 Tax=Penstemon davidsonii TaxID=160366 RepID=A0ABR0DNF0_9LAMI|nr:hypothetical protein RD792_001444 [Penstemon davidsonii]
MGKPHIIAIPCPAQGHVIPLMEVAQCLAENGIKVTFVNTDFNHERIEKALQQKGNINELIHLTSIPDGLEPWEDRNDLGKLTETILKVMPEKLESLIEQINRTENDEIVCILTDYYMGWALEMAEKFGVKRAAFLPTSVALSALTMNASKLVDDGILDNNGTPLKKQAIHLTPNMPEMNPVHFTWACISDFETQKIIFQSILQNNKSLKLADYLICNSNYELEPEAFAMVPNCIPIGPLLATNRLGKTSGHFWPEDTSCLTWLDQHPPHSVIYVAFGSFTVFNHTQFQELALGLESTNRPFLWVVRQDLIEETDESYSYPKGFEERVKNHGKMVSWAPQQNVLSHSSVALFISHCGWNSIIEGISNGVSFLCWPYFADQFLNQSYICDEWKVGLRLRKDDDSGIIRHGEINDKVEYLLADRSYTERAMNFQKNIMDSVRGGCSNKNLNKFVEWIKKN